MLEAVDSPLVSYLLIPLLIFCARICDVTLGTLRIIFVSKGMKKVAPFFGFFEILIWIVVISQVMQHANNIVCYVAYAAGFATGNFFGMMIEERLALGVCVVRVITPKNGDELVGLLNDKGFGATLISGKGKVGAVSVIYSIVSRKSIESVEKIISKFDSSIFYVVEDVRVAKRGIFPNKPAKIADADFEETQPER
ncbi:MAG: DUF2179 domain-containing protein [Prevotellaceae bacterium]|jgi:uncharacterized protein YebE (UPF0316 family)|nr:DUF2179 domain-containing protein [Prevotellaceae bacterium]